MTFYLTALRDLAFVIFAMTALDWLLAHLNPLPETVEQGAEESGDLDECLNHCGEGL